MTFELPVPWSYSVEGDIAYYLVRVGKMLWLAGAGERRSMNSLTPTTTLDQKR